MDLGNRLLNLRKKKGLSQEEVADKLGVSRQTISKWETNQSQPDFDKILPLCKLYNISTDELLKGESPDKDKEIDQREAMTDKTKKEKAKYVGLGIMLYFVAIAWFMVSIPTTDMNPMFAIAGFLIICGIATYMIVYANMVYKIKVEKEKKYEPKILKSIISVLSILTTCIYLIISFITFAWHLTWIIWLIYALIIEIIKLIFALKETTYEK